MISFISALAVLVLGYALYGRLAEKVFAPDDRQTPVNGVDFMPVKTHKAVLIQLLNIAGRTYFEIRNTKSKGEQ